MDGLAERLIACDADPWGEGAIRYPPELARSGDRPMPRQNTITIYVRPTEGADTLTLIDCPQSDPDPHAVDPRMGIRLIVQPSDQLKATRLTLDPQAVRQLRAALHRWEQGKPLAEPRN